MRYAPCLALIASCLGLASCSSLGKKPPASSPPPRAKLDTEPRATLNPDRPEAPAALASTERSGGSTEVGGLLAGQIIDSFNQRPPPTAIQVSFVREQGAAPQQVMEVAASPEGYFTIQGLQPGRYYRLTARAKLGDRLLAGATWARPPDPRVLIQISEDLATKATPPVPPAPAFQATPKEANHPSNGTAPPVKADPTWGPGRGGAAEVERRPAADLGKPERVNETTPPPSAPSPPPPAGDSRLESITDRLAKTDPPTASIPSQGSGPAPPAQGPASSAPPPPEARIPMLSCVLTGTQLYNFALYDLGGRPWEYRQHPARLTLLDFWGPWCMPCRDAIPHLNILHREFGPYGLKVVGIAYQKDVEPVRPRAIQDVADRLRVDYTMLLGSDRIMPDGRRAMCQVREQFGISSFPTLVLLDHNGRILKRWEGLGPRDLEEMKGMIGRALGAQ